MVRRSLPARLFLFLAATAWALGLIATTLHVIKVRHGLCPDHGDIVELSASFGHTGEHGTSVLPAGQDRHDHGCSLLAMAPPVGSHTSTERIARAAVPVELARPVPPPIATPPLRDAPKTSPPVLS